jgi:hypothetical protein
MKNITKIIISTFLIILLANSALGFAGMGGNANTTDIPQHTGTITQMDFNNTTESDTDIIMVQHLIEVEELKAENKLFIRETLIFRNIGTEDFYGTLRTWVPEGSETETIRFSRSEMMTGGGMIPLNFEINGTILSWKDFVEKNSSLPFLYAVEYMVTQTPSGMEKFSKKLAVSGIINYRYMEKPGLPAIIVKVNKSQGSTSRFLDEHGNVIIPTESDQKGEINRFSSPSFNELNLEILPSGAVNSQNSNASSGVSIAAIIVIGILIILALSYPYIKKKLKTEGNGDKTSDKTARISKENKIKEPSKVDSDVLSRKFERKNEKELEKLKQELSSKINDIKKEYESGNLLDEEYEDKRKSYQDDLNEIEKRLKKMG